MSRWEVIVLPYGCGLEALHTVKQESIFKLFSSHWILCNKDQKPQSGFVNLRPASKPVKFLVLPQMPECCSSTSFPRLIPTA